MKHSYISLKFIELLYRECDLFERLELEHALSEDIYLRRDYREIQHAKHALPDVLFKPGEEVVERILEYASL